MINDTMYDFFKSETGGTGSIMDLWSLFLDSASVPKGAMADRWVYWLEANGYDTSATPWLKLVLDNYSSFVSATAFDPTTLFSSGEQGMLYDFGDWTTVFTDAGGTTEATRGSLARRANDISGNAHNMATNSDVRRPTVTGIPNAIGADLAGGLATFTLGTGWSESGGVLTKTAGTASGASKSISLTAGTTYAIFIDATRTAGSLTVQLTGGTTVSGVQTINASRTTTYFMTAVSGNNAVNLSADAAFAGTVTLCKVHAATSYALDGLRFNGSDSFMLTGAIDMAHTNQATIACSYWLGNKFASMAIWDFMDYATHIGTGGAYRLVGNSPNINIGAAIGKTLTGDASGEVPTRYRTEIVALDFSQATVADQITIRTSGIEPAQTAMGTAPTIAALPNAKISIGAWTNGLFDADIQFHRFAVIDRLLTDQETADLQSWLNFGRAVVAVVGDSTVGFNSIPQGLPASAWPVAAFIPEIECEYYDIAITGDDIAEQLVRWNAITDYSGIDCVVVQVGLNTVKGDSNTKTSAQVIAEYQALIDQIASDVPAGTKIVVSQMTPCKAWLDLATDPANAYQMWQDLNEAIAGNGASPITGVDARVTAHVAVLNDGSDNLDASFDHNGDGVHPNNYGRWVIADAWRTTLKNADVIQ